MKTLTMDAWVKNTDGRDAVKGNAVKDWRQLILDNSTPEPNSGCWLWLMGTRGGYGKISLSTRTILAHRLSFAAFNGKSPDGLLVCHSCDTPVCVRPSHLFLGTLRDNIKDAFAKGRQKAPVTPGESNYWAKLTERSVLEIRRRYIPRVVTGRMLAAEYGVSIKTIEKVVSRMSWKHIP